jgi:hypothetical protein
MQIRLFPNLKPAFNGRGLSDIVCIQRHAATFVVSIQEECQQCLELFKQQNTECMTA